MDNRLLKEIVMLNRFAALIGLVFAGIAVAVPVGPGETVPLPLLENPIFPPTEGVIDQETRPVDLVFQAPAGLTFGDGAPTRTVAGTFNSSVIRDPGNQQIGFIYELISGDELTPFGFEGGSLTVESFTDFTTDFERYTVFGSQVARSADGSTITYTLPGEGQAPAPT